MEIFNYQNENDSDFFNFLDHAPNSVLTSIIQTEIVTLMKIRRKNISDQTSNELIDKLYNPPLKKNGEHKELIEVMHSDEGINAVGISPRLAGELADHAYYRLQNNIPETQSFENWYNNHYLEFIGIEQRSILIFCILKYSIRIDHGDENNIKEIEHNYLRKYLDSHPELTNIWFVSNLENKNSRLFNLIEEINQ